MIYWFLISTVNLLKWVYRAQNPEWLRFEYLLTQNIVRKLAGRPGWKRAESRPGFQLLSLLLAAPPPSAYVLKTSRIQQTFIFLFVFRGSLRFGKIRAPPVLEQLIYIVTKWAAPEEFSNMQWFCQFSPTSLLSCPTSDKSSPHRHLLLSVVLWFKATWFFFWHIFVQPTHLFLLHYNEAGRLSAVYHYLSSCLRSHLNSCASHPPLNQQGKEYIAKKPVRSWRDLIEGRTVPWESVFNDFKKRRPKKKEKKSRRRRLGLGWVKEFPCNLCRGTFSSKSQR